MKYLLTTLALTLALGPSVVLRNSTSETNIDCPSIAALVLVIYSVSKLWKAWKLIKTFPGKTVKFPKDFSTELDGTWVAILPTFIHFRYVGDLIQDMKKQPAPSWEFTWGMSPAVPYAAAILIVAICIHKLHFIVAHSTPVEKSPRSTFLS